MTLIANKTKARMRDFGMTLAEAQAPVGAGVDIFVIG